MSEPFVAEIRIFAGTFAPSGWAFCNGQLLPIAQNTALFSLIGTTYGGDGISTTALPNLQGRAPMHAGSGPGLTARSLGDRGGVETVTLTEAQMPQHTHDANANTFIGGRSGPAGNVFSKSPGIAAYKTDTAIDPVDLYAEALTSVGGGQPHTNMQPYLSVNFIIALSGLYPAWE